MRAPLAQVTLAGKIVRLEPLTLAHVEPLMEAASESRETYAIVNVPKDSASMAEFVRVALEDAARGLALPFATIDARSEKVVGTTRFGNAEYWSWPLGSIGPRNPPAPDAVEIGWTWLRASAQRTGVNTEAKLLMLAHAFEHWQVRRVTLKTDERNARSRAAITRLGAKLDGILRHHMPAFDGGVRHSAVFSILDSEWPAVRENLRSKLVVGARS